MALTAQGLEQPSTIREIHERLNVNLLAQPDLLDKIRRSDRIVYDGATLLYRPPFNIRSKDDILAVLRQQPDLTGIDLTDLKDTFPRVEEAVLVPLCAQR